ncbi:class I SAM-dependent methyltransferase [uncultured Paraglaciecola sp.]|mgnify:CR=1 FL=1|uniref:class I SAM-dependent methyltransferase n=1 Tax=uncultured Paraglaciecola sp. TaxID=1765024 RepID=UPI0030D869B3|tara:strand:+ start:448 stop:1413 length:966 start_codon:yes stop_codon:yes gene_type:complete
MFNNVYTQRSSRTNEWEKHWIKTSDTAAHASNAIHDRVTQHYWKSNLKSCILKNNQVLDLASGRGALLDIVRSCQPFQTDHGMQYCSVDLSKTALQKIKSVYPKSNVVRADCAKLPFPSNSFDLIMSQFGIEYAGLDAFFECSRVLKKSGKFMGISHYRHGALHIECVDNLEAVDFLSNIEFFRYAQLAFHAKLTGDPDVQSKQLEMVFTDILSRLFHAVSEQPKLVGGLLLRLYNDTSYMYKNWDRFEAVAIIQWLDNMEEELNNYRARMASMNESALDEASLDQALIAFKTKGFNKIIRREISINKHTQPFAWSIEVSM